jgi:hypothetical protein
MAKQANARERQEETHEQQKQYTETNTSLNKNITLEEVKTAIKRIKANKSPGPDSITHRMIKAGGEPLARVLHCLFQRIWTWGCTPRSWARALVKPIHK